MTILLSDKPLFLLLTLHLTCNGTLFKRNSLRSYKEAVGVRGITSLSNFPQSAARLLQGVTSDVDAVSKSALVAQAVHIQCGNDNLVVTVNRNLFGTGYLVKETDLSLGAAACPFSTLNTLNNTVIFNRRLHECGSTVLMNPESLVYTTDLYYTPTPYGHHLIVRTSATKIPIACIYSRKDNVSSHAVKPLSKLFTSSISSDHVMNFSLRLMNAEWTGERLSNVLNFGDLLHIEASVGLPLQVPLRLYIHNCTATPTPDENSTIKYAIIDNYGCLRDGRSNSSSSVFKIPRIQQNKLQFYLTPFRFYKDTRNTVFISCFLKAILTEHLADKINKACSFSKQENRWLPVEGPEDICECCETESCEEVTKLPGKNNLHKNHSKRDLHEWSAFEREVKIFLGPIVVLNASPEKTASSDTDPGDTKMVLARAALVSSGSILLVLALLFCRSHKPAVSFIPSDVNSNLYPN